MSKDVQFPRLGSSGEDRIAAVVKSVGGAVPWVGSAIVELVSNIIPNQRIDRVERYLGMLTQELSRLESGLSGSILVEPENVALLEDGMFQAARSTTDERREYIAKVVAKGISAEERRKVHSRRILSLLGDIDDEELMILDAYADRAKEKFERVRPPVTSLGSDQSAIDTEALYEAGRDKLERLGLLRFNQKFDKDTGQMEFDLRGRRRGSYRITRLGVLLLKSIGITNDGE